MLKTALVAGETSGDLLAGLLLDGMRARWPDGHSFGIGGPHMAARGFQAWWPYDKLAVHGFGWEVLRRYPEIAGIRRQLKNRLLRDRPDIFIGVDAPDFNLDLAAALRQQGIKTAHFVCPSVWAWRAGRLEKIKRSVDHVLCIFPFEPELLARHGIAATYVGHPLANVIAMQPDRSAARARLGLSPDLPLVAILPGSRQSEIKHLSEVFLQAASLIRQAQPQTQFVLPVLPSLVPAIQAAVAASGLASALHVLVGQSYCALEACDVGLLASGTACLEAALFKRPMVIAYRMAGLSWQIMRRQQLQPWIGLPNILCREFVVPELLQHAATPSALAQEVLRWLTTCAHEPAKITQLEQRFTQLHADLKRDTPSLCAAAIASIL